MSWFVERVLPGLLDGVPYLCVGVTGLWLTIRSQRRDAERRHLALHEHLPGTCPYCAQEGR